MFGLIGWRFDETSTAIVIDVCACSEMAAVSRARADAAAYPRDDRVGTGARRARCVPRGNLRFVQCFRRSLRSLVSDHANLSAAIASLARCYLPKTGWPKSSVSRCRYLLFSWQMYSDSSAFARHGMSHATLNDFV